MAELRKDPLLERWVLIAEERAARPQEFLDRPVVRRSGDCPFCAGSEAATPHEVFALREPDTNPDAPGWRVRVIPNKYPAVTVDGEGEGAAFAEVGRPNSPPVRQSAAGVHEVIIESAEHIITAGRLTDRQTLDVLNVYQARLRALRADGELAYVQIFRNVGEAAGASIEHLHSQLLGLRMVPPLVAEEVAAAQTFYERSGRCAFCESAAREIAAGERVVEATENFLLSCPYASRFPYEMCLTPRGHLADFDAANMAQIAEAAALLRRGLARLEQVCDEAAYNCVLHTAPFDCQKVPHYHWHIEILPRIVKAAGFEWGTGVHINPVPPERAAAALRGANLC